MDLNKKKIDMRKLQIKRHTYNRLTKYSSESLLSLVFTDFGYANIEIDDSQTCEDRWDITDFIDNGNIPLLEKLKVIFIFDHLLGHVIYEGKETFFSVLGACLGNRSEFQKVLFYWLHTKMNGEVPFFDVGDIEVPDVQPRFIGIEVGENAFEIHQLIKGEYVRMDGKFTSKDLCDKRIMELELDAIYDEMGL